MYPFLKVDTEIDISQDKRGVFVSNNKTGYENNHVSALIWTMAYPVRKVDTESTIYSNLLVENVSKMKTGYAG